MTRRSASHPPPHARRVIAPGSDQASQLFGPTRQQRAACAVVAAAAVAPAAFAAAVASAIRWGRQPCPRQLLAKAPAGRGAARLECDARRLSFVYPFRPCAPPCAFRRVSRPRVSSCAPRPALACHRPWPPAPRVIPRPCRVTPPGLSAKSVDSPGCIRSTFRADSAAASSLRRRRCRCRRPRRLRGRRRLRKSMGSPTVRSAAPGQGAIWPRRRQVEVRCASPLLGVSFPTVCAAMRLLEGSASTRVSLRAAARPRVPPSLAARAASHPASLSCDAARLECQERRLAWVYPFHFSGRLVCSGQPAPSSLPPPSPPPPSRPPSPPQVDGVTSRALTSPWPGRQLAVAPPGWRAMRVASPGCILSDRVRRHAPSGG